MVNTGGGMPGFVNNLTGGSNGGATGNVSIYNPDFTVAGRTEMVAAAIHATDSAGPSHSLSSLSDPALADIVFDLNHANIGGVATVTAYAFANAPAQYAPQVAALAAGEAANGGQSFDLLLTINNTNLPLQQVGGLWWAFDLSGEIGQLDGISAIKVTDVAAVPEPTAGLLLLLVGAVLVTRGHRLQRSGLTHPLDSETPPFCRHLH